MRLLVSIADPFPASLVFSSSGLLCSALSISSLFCPGLFCGSSGPGHAATKVCAQLYLRFHHVHGELCHYEGTERTLDEHACGRSTIIHDNLPGKHGHDAILDVYQGRSPWLCASLDCECGPAGGAVVVLDFLFTGRNHGSEHCHASNLYHAAAGYCWMYATARNVCGSVYTVCIEVVLLTRIGNATAHQLMDRE